MTIYTKHTTKPLSRRFIFSSLTEYTPEAHRALLSEAIEYSYELHKGQTSLSGEPFYLHPLNVAYIASQLRLDTASLILALLHNSGYGKTEEERKEIYTQIRARFGYEISKMVKAVAHISIATHSNSSPENITRYILRSNRDLRVIMIKLADKLHNARSIDALSDVRRELAANNLMNIYTPIATYLNLFHIKSEFEETGFSILYPHEHQYINSILKKRRERDSSRVDRIQAFLEKEAKKVIKQDVAIFGRIKSEYSIYKKLERKKMYSNEKTIDQVMDLLAFTVLMPTEESCYQYAAMLMRDAHVELRQYDDYIRKAKKNGYRSLHLILMPNGISDRCYEVQIKTPEMHHYNLYGPASHIGYKEEYGEKRSSFEYYWVKDVHRRIYEYRNKEKIKLSEPVCAEMFENKIYLFTPSNEIVEMPVGSTVIDLAYRLHSRIGNKAKSATVNGKKVELDQMLKNGDRLEIVLDEKQKLPQRDWLKFVRTRRARDAIETEYRNHLINSEKGFTPSV